MIGDDFQLFLIVGFIRVIFHTWDLPSNMDPHGNTQSKTQVDAEVLSKRSLTCHNLSHRPQAKRLDTEMRNHAIKKEEITGGTSRECNLGKPVPDLAHLAP